MRTFVKICGVRTEDDVECALRAGADAVGLVLAEGSPRTVDVDTARRLARSARRLATSLRRHVGVWAVFRGVEAEGLEGAAAAGLHCIQAEQVRLPALLRGAAPGFVPVVRDGDGLAERVAAAGACAANPLGAVLVDGPRGGGQGVVGDHRRIAAVAWRCPLILAGGLTPETVADAVRRVRPAGVDVSSGVESIRGVKDHEAVRAFVAAVRAVDAEDEGPPRGFGRATRATWSAAPQEVM